MLNDVNLCTEQILRMSMDDLMGFFQGELVKNFGYSDDLTIESLLICEAELRRVGLDLPAPASDSSELPTQPFGLFVPPSVEQVIGRRTIETETELIRGRGRDRQTTLRRDSRMSISIPPDGGPAFVESLDLPSSGARLISIDKVEEEDVDRRVSRANVVNGGKASNSKSADQRRANYANTHSVANGQVQSGERRSAVGNKPADRQSSNGGLANVRPPVSARQQKASFSRKSTKSTGRDFPSESDLAAPQQYGVTVRL